jgi:transcription elongation factor Elf1
MTGEIDETPKAPRKREPGECPKCGGLSAFVKEINQKSRTATLQCQNTSCEHEWSVDWPIGRRPGKPREWRGMEQSERVQKDQR